MTDDDFIVVECLDIASMLELCGITFDRVDTSSPNRARFFYPNSPEVRRWLKSHYCGRIKLRYKSLNTSLIDFTIQRQNLKARVNGLRGLGADNVS